MRNALYRIQNVWDTPAVPAVPGTPERIVYEDGLEQKWQCDKWGPAGRGDGGAMGAGSSGDDRTLQVCLGGHWEYTKTKKARTIPATPGTPAVPGYTSVSPSKGWNSHARSIGTFESYGYAEFTVPSNVTGVAAGLTWRGPVSDTGIEHIPYGVLFTGNKAFSLKTGLSLGSYGNADVWRVRAVYGAVEIYRNGVLVATEPTTAFAGMTVALAASLYWLDSYVLNPSIVNQNVTLADIQLPSLQMRVAANDEAEVDITLPRLTMTAVVPPGMYAALPSLQMRAVSGDIAEIDITLPRLVMESAGGFPAIVEQAGADIRMPALVMACVAEAPWETVVDATIPAMDMQGLLGNIAVANLQLPAMWMAAKASPAGVMVLEENAYAGAFGLSAAEHLMRIAARGGITAALAAGELAEMMLAAALEMGDGLSFDQLLEMLIEALLAAGDAPAIPATDETWVYGTQTNTTTRYTFGCNSFARIGEHYYGATAEGLYRLDGDTDDGAPIRARIGFGTPTFGTSALKTIQDAYAGMSASGHLYLKVTANGQTYTYRSRAFSPEMKQQRFDTGRGLRASVFGLELVNDGGADFEIDTVEFRTLPLSRRIQS